MPSRPQLVVQELVIIGSNFKRISIGVSEVKRPGADMIDLLGIAEHFAKMGAPSQKILAIHAECDGGAGRLRREFKKGNRDGAIRVAKE